MGEGDRVKERKLKKAFGVQENRDQKRALQKKGERKMVAKE